MARGRYFPVQTVDRGRVGNYGTMAEPVSARGPWLGQVGMTVESGGKVWRLVRLDFDADAVDTIDGGIAYWEDLALFTVTFDASNSQMADNGVAGGVHQVVDVSALTEDQFMWVQIGGIQLAVVVSGTGEAGAMLSGIVDNVLTVTAAGIAPINKTVATQITAQATTTSDEGASVGSAATVRWDLGAML